MLCSPKKNPTIFFKKTFFSRKHDFSRQLESGTGLQGVSSNLNLMPSQWTMVILWNIFCSLPTENFPIVFFNPSNKNTSPNLQYMHKYEYITIYFVQFHVSSLRRSAQSRVKNSTMQGKKKNLLKYVHLTSFQKQLWVTWKAGAWLLVCLSRICDWIH